MKLKPFYRNFFIIIGIVAVFLFFSLYLAHLVRFDFRIPYQHVSLFFKILPLVVVIKLVSFFYFDLYRGMWRYTSITDLFNVIKAWND